MNPNNYYVLETLNDGEIRKYANGTRAGQLTYFKSGKESKPYKSVKELIEGISTLQTSNTIASATEKPKLANRKVGTK